MQLQFTFLNFMNYFIFFFFLFKSGIHNVSLIFRRYYYYIIIIQTLFY